MHKSPEFFDDNMNRNLISQDSMDQILSILRITVIENWAMILSKNLSHATVKISSQVFVGK